MAIKSVKNVTQGIHFRKYQLFTSDLEEGQREISAEFRKALLTKDEEAQAAAAEKLKGSLNKAQEQDLARLGGGCPTDKVEVKVRLGDVLFELWSSRSIVPTAPLAKAVHQRAAQEFAEELKKDAITAPEEVAEKAHTVLMDDALWNQFACYAWIDVEVEEDEEPRRINTSINSVALNMYTEVIQGLISAVEGYDEPKTPKDPKSR